MPWSLVVACRDTLAVVPALRRLYPPPNENVWRHLSHVKSVIQSGTRSTHPRIASYMMSGVFLEFSC